MESVTTLESLPSEMLVQVISKLSIPEIVRLCRVSRRLAEFCADETFWSQKARREFQYPQEQFLQASTGSPLQRYARIREMYYHPDIALNEAIYEGRRQDVAYILPRLRQRIRSLRTGLLLAAAFGESAIILDLLNAGAGGIKSALEIAAQEGQTDAIFTILEWLEQKGRTIDLTQTIGQAVIGGHDELVLELTPTEAARDYALLVATRFGSMNLMEELVAEGVSMNALDRSLVEAAEEGNDDRVNYLLSVGATNLIEAIEAAKYSDHEDLAKRLRQYQTVAISNSAGANEPIAGSQN